MATLPEAATGPSWHPEAMGGRSEGLAFEQRKSREVAELREGTWQWKAKQQSLAARAARAGKPGYTSTGAKA